ncbi:hypothetical protein [Xanthomonas graminis]|uniref:hypothetical protein n=1 Tax=Xanthomonas graminis TaxID=3390026 RepID=UPI001F364341|nr:hypothetical protein [Xanthomonas translucens]UKE72386.1 hypothetical protein KFS85_15160 [Xanthomonas translucens pv. phleipratensis]
MSAGPQTNGSRLLELACDVSAGLMDANEQRELGLLLCDAALWNGNPLRQLSPVGRAYPKDDMPAEDIARIETATRDALAYVGQRIDGMVEQLAERAELWMRESQCLIFGSAHRIQSERAALEF